MKKVIAILTAVILVLCVGTSAYAANYTPSVSEKEAPEVVEQVVAGTPVAGTIVNNAGQVVEGIEANRLIVTPVAEVNTSTEIPQESAENLKDAFEELSHADIKLSDLIDELDEDVKESLGNDKTVDHLIVRDLFDVTLVDAQGNVAEVDDDHRLVVTFNIGIEKGKPVFAMKYNENNEWEPVAAIHNNGDGTVTCEFAHLCPIAFLVPDVEEDDNSGSGSGSQGGTGSDSGSGSTSTPGDSAQTGDNSVSLYVWVAIAVVAAGLIVVLFVAKNKKENVTE